MAMDKSQTIAVAFCFCTWAVYMGGLAALQNTCNQDNIFPRGDGFTDRTVFDCYQLYGYYWFVSTYMFILVCCSAMSALGGFTSSNTSYACLYAVGTVLYIEVSRCFIPVDQQVQFENNSTAQARVRCVIAGAIMTAIASGVATFVFGHDKSKSEYYAAKKHSEAHAPHGANSA